MTLLVLFCLAGLIVAAAAAFLQAQKAEGWRRSAEAATVRAAQAEAEAEAARRGAAEQVRLLESAQGRLEQSFRALAADALHTNSQSLLERNREQVHSVVAPVQETLKRFETSLQHMEKTRSEAYGGLTEQLKGLLDSERELRRSADQLRNALRAPQQRGRWGEIQLRRAVELAGMIAHCDFSEQVMVDGARLRPDVVIHLPNGRNLAVDAKVSLDAYLKAVDSEQETDRERFLTEHARQVRTHIRLLSEKSYWDRLQGSPEFVVAFLPLESIYSAALQYDGELLSYGVEKRVLLATPTTLIALLFAVAQGWRERDFSENSMRIRELGKELYDRLCGVHGNLGLLGKQLQGAVEAFNSTVWNMESRVWVTARRFRELQGNSGMNSLDELPLIAREPRMPVPATVPEA